MLTVKQRKLDSFARQFHAVGLAVSHLMLHLQLTIKLNNCDVDFQKRHVIIELHGY